jgi:hypothetical protein
MISSNDMVLNKLLHVGKLHLHRFGLARIAATKSDMLQSVDWDDISASACTPIKWTSGTALFCL